MHYSEDSLADACSCGHKEQGQGPFSSMVRRRGYGHLLLVCLRRPQRRHRRRAAVSDAGGGAGGGRAWGKAEGMG